MVKVIYATPPKLGYVVIEDEFDGRPHCLIDICKKRDEGCPMYLIFPRKKFVELAACGWEIVFDEECELVKSDDVDVELLDE